MTPAYDTHGRAGADGTRMAVAGASGFVGSRLCPALQRAGHEVRALTRRPGRYRGAGVAVGADVCDGRTLVTALDGCSVAYYLVHSLDHANFARDDATAAVAFGAAAAEAGIGRIIYLGGLGREDCRADDRGGRPLSAHLRSRREVETLLGHAGVPVTTLRAAVIVGHGGVSWEMVRRLVELLPVLIALPWLDTRTQPIAIADVIEYLLAVLDHAETVGQTFEIGGAEVLDYADMLRRVAAIEGRRTLVAPVPGLHPPRVMAAAWLALLTGADLHTCRALIGSVDNQVIVHDDAIRRLVPFEPMGYDDAVLAALGERARAARSRTDHPACGRPVVGRTVPEWVG